MKTLLKGIIYATSLVMVNRLILSFNMQQVAFWAFVIFFLVGAGYLATSRSLGRMFGCGFTALFALVPIDLIIGLEESFYPSDWFEVYMYGFFGTMVAVLASYMLIETGVSEKLLNKMQEKGGKMQENEIFSKSLKFKMLIYAALTALSFACLVLADGAGVSVFVFIALQAVMLSFVVTEKKKLLWLIPMGVLCLNSFLSANTIWRVPNFIVCVVLFGLMFTPLNIKNVTLGFFVDIAERVCAPLIDLTTPVSWFFEITEGKKGYVKRGAIAAAISLACVIVLCAVLSSADMVFLHGVEDFTDYFSGIFTAKTLWKIALGILAGLYLFGVVYNSYFTYDKDDKEFKIKGDLLIIACVMLSVLAVYTIFVVIQFKYLFAGGTLPYGLNVTEYARKGFFELLGLTGVNLAAILIVTKLTEHIKGKRAVFVKAINMYLCAVTVVLLASSFYRMQIYNETDGLTRLRFLVFGFLAFELIGLLATFFYIAKPKFNIVMVYGALALCYYMVLNVVPMDAIVAKNQVDRYLSGQRNETIYVRTLSIDAAEEIARIYHESADPIAIQNAEKWIEEKQAEAKRLDNGWRSFNLSRERLYKICGELK
ncbi:MAG: DUF4173 domain-containing protein [Clostridia bacterium]|nr:DUF4173 domain-containing protein [Clostridia bacterium]